MIDVKELRIGSYVAYGIKFDKSLAISMIKGIEENKVLLDSDLVCLLEQIKEIRLTEDLLLCCGFEKKYWREKDIFYFELNRFIIILHVKEFGRGIMYWKDEVLFQYVVPLHRLQNVYKDLTETDLIIDLKKYQNEQ